MTTLCVYKQFILAGDKMKSSLLLCLVCWIYASEAFVPQGKPHSQAKPVMPLLCQSQNARLSAVAGCLRLTTPLFVEDISMEEKIFNLNCAARYAEGQNSVVSDHTLEKVAIEKYLTGGFNEKALVYQVSHGKNAMPAFGGRLSDEDTANVAVYVLKNAKDSWD